MEIIEVQVGDSLFRVSAFGTGSEVLVCLHGYGEAGEGFVGLARALAEDAPQAEQKVKTAPEDHSGQTAGSVPLNMPIPGRFRLLAIDMPYHGGTQWKENRPLRPGELISLIDQLVPGRGGRFSLLGYSMGGRIALQLFQLCPERINALFLLAGDGLRPNFWQQFSTNTAMGRFIFYQTMKHPGGLFALMKLGIALGWIDANREKFFHYYLDEAKERMLLYARWVCFRHFYPSRKLLRKIIQEHAEPQGGTHQARISLIFGAYDKIIPTAWGRRFAKGLESQIRISEIRAGHQLLQEKYIPELKALLTA